MKEFLKEIGITKLGYYNDDGDYFIDVENADEYGMYFSLLDKAKNISQGSTKSNGDKITLEYWSEDDRFSIVLFMDLDKDKYALSVKEYED